MSFEVIGGGLPPLTVEMRSCMLRAARRELHRMQADLYRLQSLNVRYMQGPIAVTEQELECLGAAITWLHQIPTN
jgi:hypothetical protein